MIEARFFEACRAAGRAGLLAALVLAPGLVAGGPELAGEARAVLDAQQRAWNRGDLRAFLDGYWESEELVFQSGATVTRGFQATLQRYRERYQGEGREMGVLSFSDVHVEPLSADAAYVRGAWRLRMKDASEPHGLFTLIFRRIPGQGLRIVHDHTSSQ